MLSKLSGYSDEVKTRAIFSHCSGQTCGKASSRETRLEIFHKNIKEQYSEIKARAKSSDGMILMLLPLL